MALQQIIFCQGLHQGPAHYRTHNSSDSTAFEILFPLILATGIAGAGLATSYFWVSQDAMGFSKPILNPTSEITVTRDDFEVWLFSIDEELDAFFSSLPANIGEKLDYSLDSLLELEAFILKKYDSINSIMNAKNNLEIDRLAKYVGESIRKSIGGKWDIELDDPTDAFYRLPVLTHEKYGKECPVTLVTASADRRKGDYIFKVANNKKKRMAS